VCSRLPRDILILKLEPHRARGQTSTLFSFQHYILQPELHCIPTCIDVALTYVSVRTVSDLKAVDTMTPPDQNGKRKRVDVDLTADDTDTDTDDLDAPMKEPKRQETSSAQSLQHQSQKIPTNSNGATQRSNVTSNFRGSYSSYPSGGSMPVSSQHTEAERRDWLNEDDDDINETIGSTQEDAANGSDELHLYGDLSTKIVGVQYYRGFACEGEVILIRREPGNPYDSNAIRIDNVNRQQIGHIPRRMAEKLSRYIDDRSLHCEGKLAGSVGTFDCPLTVRLYGPDPSSDAGRALASRMSADKLSTNALKEAERARKQREKEQQQQEKRRQQEEKRRRVEALRAASGGKGGRVPVANTNSEWANQNTPGDDPSAPVMEDILEASQRFNPREIGDTADKAGLHEAALQDMPMAPQPAAIKTKMLPHQLQGLQWLLDHENPPLPGAKDSDAVQLWKKHPKTPGAYMNLATSYSVQGPPKFAIGGILADDMGLGKTLEMISLMVADNAKSSGRSGSTLIVCPLSVMSNWTDQIARHTHDDYALRVYIYHGPGRESSMKAVDFADYDVVITTYQTLASDWMPRNKAGSKQPQQGLRASGLYSVEWRRIILDEGHIVRNPSSKGAGAVMAVTAKSKFVLSGTPIVNSLRDLYTLLRFVGITGGLEQLEVFNSVLVRPLKSGSVDVTFLLQAIMAAFTLRRRKEMSFIDLRLPKIEECKHAVTFTDKEKARYEAFEKQAKGQLAKYNNQGSAGSQKAKAFQTLLEILLRMRQCCNHWQLCGERVMGVMEQLERQGTVSLNEDTKKGLQDLLQVHIESQEECAVCLEDLHNPVITTCGHFFGFDCISKVIETQHKCPMCRAELKDDSCLVQPANDCGDEVSDGTMDLDASSSKLEAMMTILSATKVKKDKTVIFSQWTRFLDIVQARLEKEGYKFCRIDGTMPAHRRDASLRALENDDDTTIMLASLGVCAVGLNLTRANQIILSDSWWAPAVEDQAVDRVHRLGQKKDCRVFRLVVEGTIEDNVLSIQQDKRKLMRLAFGEKKGKRDEVKTGRLADIQRLLHGQ
jgi:SWI/SNF-related matrix-associated actin-dependent regulator of chromatin subfamily A3